MNTKNNKFGFIQLALTRPQLYFGADKVLFNIAGTNHNSKFNFYMGRRVVLLFSYMLLLKLTTRPPPTEFCGANMLLMVHKFHTYVYALLFLQS